MNKFKKVFDKKWWFYDFLKWSGFWSIALYYRIKKLYPFGKSKKLLKGKLIICSNHISYEDAAAIITGIWKRRVSFLATKDLFDKKGFKGFFRHVGCIPVDKSNFDIDSIKKAIEVIDRGHVIGIFPEGQVNRDRVLSKFKSGIVMTAFLAGADILPIYLSGRKNRFQRERMVIGQRIKFKELIKSHYPTIDEINKITDLLNQREQELKDYYEKRYPEKKKGAK